MTARSKRVAVIAVRASPLGAVGERLYHQNPVARVGASGIRNGGFGSDRLIADAAIEALRGLVPARNDHAQGRSARVVGVALGNFEQGRGDAQSAELGERR